MSINRLLFDAEEQFSKLTPKRKRFVEEYLKDCNSTQAYIRAGYSANTDKVAQVEGHKLLNNPSVSACIEAFQKARSLRTQVTADRVIEELARIAFSDISKILPHAPKLISDRGMDAIPEDLRRSIRSFKYKTGDYPSFEVTLWNKTVALSKLCDHLGLTKPKEDTGESTTLLEFLNKQVAMMNASKQQHEAVGDQAGTQDRGEPVPH